MRNNLNRVPANALARRDAFGRVLVGGPIGLRDITSQPFPGAEFIADIIPGSAQERSINRLQDQYAAYQNAERPLTKALRAADMALEGSGLAADLFPAIKAGAATASFLLPMMARHNEAMSGIARALKKQRGIIGGPGAKTADMDALDLATMLKGQGRSADEIFEKTGWWLDHPDGVPRFEIDDSGAVPGHRFYTWGEKADFDAGNSVLMRRQKALLHPELSAAYPETKKTGVLGYKGKQGGAFDESSDMVHVGLNPENAAANRSVMLHELQHKVQSIEDMARGGNPDMMQLSTDIWGIAKNEWEEFYDALAQTGVDLKDAPSPSELRTINVDRYIDEMLFLAGKAESGVTREGAEALIRVENAAAALDSKLGDLLSPELLYHRLAGEVEARLVQDRMNMPPKKRAARPFYKEFDVPIEDQVIRYD